MKKVINYFLQGLLYVAPISITFYILYIIFDFADGLLEDILESIIGRRVPGLGLVLIFVFLVIVGMIGQSIFARPFKKLFEKLLSRAPLLKLVYSAMTDLFSAFVGKEKKFNQPVIVQLNPGSNLEKLGFLTNEDLKKLNVLEKVAVYFPHSYNFSGELYIVPKTQVRALDINPAVLMKFIVSGGISDLNITNAHN